MSVKKAKDIDINNIKFKKHFKTIDNNYQIDIKYRCNDQLVPLIIQTPKLYIPFGITKYNNYWYIDMSLFNNETEEFILFYKFIKKIIKIVKLYSKKYDIITKSHKYIDIIKPKKDIYPERIKFKYLNEVTSIFNINKDKLPEDSITKKIYAKSIIHISNLWINEKFWGININVLQLCIDPIINLKEFSFIDDVPDNNKEKYSKYFKLLSMGVPKDAVKQKLILDNLDPNIIDETKQSIKTIPLSLPLINLKPKLFNQNILGDIKSGFNLKKTKINKKQKNPISSHLNPINLKDILDTRNKLKKTKQN